jgi:Hyaluronidase
LYDPGAFPALGTNSERRNGGVPQEGNLTYHLNEYMIALNQLVPDKDYSGKAIIGKRNLCALCLKHAHICLYILFNN